MKRLAILLSGRGSNFEAIAANITAGALDAQIAVVLSNRAAAPGIERARALGLHVAVIPSRGLDREAYDRLLHDEISKNGVDLVCLAGYMRLLSAGFVAHFAGRLLNIHPSLLPAFKGLNPQAQALAAGVKISGCTVHFVTEDLDGGPIIAQTAVPVCEGDTAQSLAARILRAEHALYPQALALVAEGRARLRDGRVNVLAPTS